MKKKLLVAFLGIAVTITILLGVEKLFTSSAKSELRLVATAKQSDCLTDTSKRRTDECGPNNDGLDVYVENVCDEPMDIKICIQKSNGKYSCFQDDNVQPGRKATAWACNGITGYYKYYGRVAGSNARFPDPNE